MVTSEKATKLADILEKSNSTKWDLLDKRKKAAWILRTKTALREDAEAYHDRFGSPPVKCAACLCAMRVSRVLARVSEGPG